MEKKEQKTIRTMRVVRSWLKEEGIFKYFTVYSNGEIRDATRRDADKYAKAYSVQIETVIGLPKQ